MAKLNKQKLLDALDVFGVEVPAKATNTKLARLLKKAEKDSAKLEQEVPKEDVEVEKDVEEDRIENDDELRLESPPQELPEDEEEGDYLRKYQYRKGTVRGSVNSDPQPGSKAAAMKARLLKQEVVSIFVPRTDGESPSILGTVNLNGYRLDFPKQAYINLPMQVAKVLMGSLAQTEEAILQGQISKDPKKKDALL